MIAGRRGSVVPLHFFLYHSEYQVTVPEYKRSGLHVLIKSDSSAQNKITNT